MTSTPRGSKKAASKIGKKVEMRDLAPRAAGGPKGGVDGTQSIFNKEFWNGPGGTGPTS